MQDTPDAHAHFGWFKRRRHLKVDEITVVDKPMLKRAVGAAALGNAMEWFDFGVYGYLAVTIGQVFFPSSNPTAQVIAAFATFTVAFLVRPLGGLVFGPLGDRYGRQKVLAFTMILMALGTFAIGLIPAYERIGIWAPVLLLLARVVQGFSTGGEYGGAATFIAEYSTDRNRGLMGSWLEFGTLGGYIAGAGTVTALHMLLSSEQMLDWGWRIPFLVAGPLGLLGLYMRMKLEETPAFRAFAEEAEKREHERPGLGALFQVHGRQLLVLPIWATGRWRKGCSNQDQPATTLSSEADGVGQSALGNLRSIERNNDGAEHVTTPLSRVRYRSQHARRCEDRPRPAG